MATSRSKQAPIPAKWRKLLKLIPGYDPVTTAPKGTVFHVPHAEQAVAFFHEMLQHVKGHKGGQPFLLEPWQKAVLGCLFGWRKPDGTRRYREVWFYVPRKNGKMLALDTPIPTPSGWTTMGEVRRGDEVFDERGMPCRVTYESAINATPESYDVHFSNGEHIKACADHQWMTSAKVAIPGDKRSGRTKRFLTSIRTTKEIYETLQYGKRGDLNHSIAMPFPLETPAIPLPIDPYFLGCWLGDGDVDQSRITCHETEVEHYISQFERAGIPAKVQVTSQRAPRIHAFGMLKYLASLSLVRNKHIPAVYLRSSIPQRLALLQGLLDTDGFIEKRGCSIELTTVFPRLASDIGELLASLGIKYRCKQRESWLYGVQKRDRYRIQFFVPRDYLPLFRIERKLERQPYSFQRRIASRCRTVQIVSVAPCDPVPMRCIAVDSPSHLYLAGKTMLPTHNTPFAGGLVLYMLITDPEPGIEAYSAAADRDQAALVYQYVHGMILAEPLLKERLKVYTATKVVEYLDRFAYYKVLSALPDSKHGLNVHLAVIDETHAHKNPELMDVLLTGTAARKQPLIIHTTTADYLRESICNEKYEYACQVRDRVIDDPAFLPVIYEAKPPEDEGKDPLWWTHEAVWKQANPNYGVSVEPDYIKRECQRALDSPRLRATFQRLHLNIRTGQEQVWFGLEVWDGCHDASFDAEALQGQACFAGLDLASTSDLCAFVLWFPEPQAIVPFFWLPAETILKRKETAGIPYDQWVHEGHIRTTPGNVTDYDRIRDDINQLQTVYNIREIAIDRWNSTQLQTQLSGDGFDVVPFGQGFASMSAPSKELERLLLAGELRHDGNPVMRWMASHVAVEDDAAANLKPSKKQSHEKIDGIVALIMALGRALVQEAEPESIYATRGLARL